MLKRSVVFQNPAMLSLKDRQLVVKLKDFPDEKRTIPIEDLGFVMIDNALVSITMPLLNALSDNNIAVVFCNEKGMPASMLQNLDTNNTQGEVLQNQINATEPLKKNLWKQVVEAKIRNQSNLLIKYGKNGEQLKPYYKNVASGDSNNNEGIAARIYFQELFGKNFVRNRDLPGVNALLNYGYTVLRAATARAIMSSGLFPALGIFHHNRSNAFPLADDMMEPYRPFVDEIVFQLLKDGKENLDKETKGRLIRVMYSDTWFPKTMRPLDIGLSMTMASLAKCLAKEQKSLSLPALK
ncbi:type II CRISPR-associated endonuclease Cas1 [Prevotella sp. KH2C16]|uniref:type II CRISPR-associated endonuclease Cas1 n=1 Tax=Prevotella sp. KH2C16 TaxID=1855325 RepID=UPI0008F3A7CD|nr:type II CRISPR-associated endonuclease Cas1 [Prevotella sp. KH2C16]SFG16721.1 CRISP-associated protein Cas1 [Prevotella sp. KH2C16]